jgi:quinol-cytochrome oxidoreductase complex cytochrome b subunit
MVIVVILHMARVFYTGAYKPPREFNWIIGVMLLLLTLGASFTGYLLPWDQLAYWAITVGTNIAGYAPVAGPATREILLGGSEVGQNALLRFYALHVAILPVLMTLLISIHFWRVRKDGGLAANEGGGQDQGSS